ncbi:DUF4259 domain-containing protein [Streptomyces sp. NPDC020412]|uniref:DUF4259 domain-containing protein n=1 Tax=Streptomyces sp. NPDC020412 TaxID=3365073 RepID=UPI0037AD8F74
MGTWDTGPFDNDSAADFAGRLDDAAPGEREAIVRSTLIRALEVAAPDFLDSHEGDQAVAAAALVAAQCPDGETVNPNYGPKQPLPVFGPGLRPLAVRALDRVVEDGSELVELWEGEDAVEWRKGVHRLRCVLTARPGAYEEVPRGA